MLVSINGKCYAREQATVSVFDHGLLYGDGVFETLRVYNNHVFHIEDHLERLQQSAKAINLSLPLSLKELKQAVERTVALNKYGDAAVRVIVTRGIGELGLTTQCTPTTIILVDKFQPKDEVVYSQGVKIITLHQSRAFHKIKTLNYLPNVLGKQRAHKAGAYEAVFLAKDNMVTEGTTSNFFMVKNNQVITSLDVLEGITRKIVLLLAQQQNYSVEQRPLQLREVYTTDECFLTSTLTEIVPVVKVDNVIIKTGKPGKITQQLMQEFKKALPR